MQGRHVDVRIPLASVDTVHWPVRPLVGDGEPIVVPIPLPGLLWQRPGSLPVPLGMGAVQRVATVERLRKLYTYIVAPVAILLLLLSLALAVLSWSTTFSSGLDIGRFLALTALCLIFLSIVPKIAAIVTRTPRVAGNHLLLPSAHSDVAREMVSLNPPGLIQVQGRR